MNDWLLAHSAKITGTLALATILLVGATAWLLRHDIQRGEDVQAQGQRITVIERTLSVEERRALNRSRLSIRRHRRLICNIGRLVGVAPVSSPARLRNETRQSRARRLRTVRRFRRGLNRINCRTLKLVRRGGGRQSPGSSPVQQPGPLSSGSRPTPPGNAPAKVCKRAPKACRAPGQSKK